MWYSSHPPLIAAGPSCAKDAKAEVTKLCVGKAACTIPTTPATFGGDPCPAVKTPKALAVRATCSSAGPKPPAAPRAYVFDFGQNMAGFATLNVSGLAAGTEILMRFGEVLNKDGSVDMAWCGDHCNVGPGGGNSANQSDKYIAKGGAGPELFTPHFTCKCWGVCCLWRISGSALSHSQSHSPD